jgi:hypothetical protein
MRVVVRRGGPRADAARKSFIDFSQWRTERMQSGIRRKLLKSDKQQGDILSFSGRPE